MTSIFAFSLRFVALYALLLGVLALPPIEHLAGGIVATAASGVLNLCLGRSVASSVSGSDLLFMVAADKPGETWQVSIDALEHLRNLPLFTAIVLAAGWARRWRPRRRLVEVLLIGALGLIVLDGLIVAAEAWEKLPDAVPLTATYQVLAALAIFHATGGAGLFAAPVFVGALGVLTLRDERNGAGGGRPRRNDRCPCGSGRKFKHCCGAA